VPHGVDRATLPFNFHVGSCVHKQPHTDKIFSAVQFGNEAQDVYCHGNLP
jgi:hypothetical protein